jgi:hypothetical protein
MDRMNTGEKTRIGNPTDQRAMQITEYGVLNKKTKLLIDSIVHLSNNTRELHCGCHGSVNIPNGVSREVIKKRQVLLEQFCWRQCDEREPPIGKDGFLFIQWEYKRFR